MSSKIKKGNTLKHTFIKQAPVLNKHRLQKISQVGSITGTLLFAAGARKEGGPLDGEV